MAHVTGRVCMGEHGEEPVGLWEKGWTEQVGHVWGNSTGEGTCEHSAGGSAGEKGVQCRVGTRGRSA